MEHPKDIGDRSALAIAIALQGIGHAVYLPFGENTRADFIIDDGTRLARGSVQDGTATQRRRAIQDVQQLRPSLEPGIGSARLPRPAKNGQRLRVRYARDHEIGRVHVTRPIPDSDLGRVDEVGG